MIPGPRQAIDRLDHLTGLFEHARVEAARHSSALSALLDQAELLLGETAGAIPAASGGPHEGAVLTAALRAKASHSALMADLGVEVAAIASALRRLSAGVHATDQYAPAAKRLAVGSFEGVG